MRRLMLRIAGLTTAVALAATARLAVVAAVAEATGRGDVGDVVIDL